MPGLQLNKESLVYSTEPCHHKKKEMYIPVNCLFVTGNAPHLLNVNPGIKQTKIPQFTFKAAHITLMVGHSKDSLVGIQNTFFGFMVIAIGLRSYVYRLIPRHVRNIIATTVAPRYLISPSHC